jgi:hypothetical protein
MAGQAALLTREEVKSTIRSIECNKGSKPSSGKKMSVKMNSQSKEK